MPPKDCNVPDTKTNCQAPLLLMKGNTIRIIGALKDQQQQMRLPEERLVHSAEHANYLIASVELSDPPTNALYRRRDVNPHNEPGIFVRYNPRYISGEITMSR